MLFTKKLIFVVVFALAALSTASAADPGLENAFVPAMSQQDSILRFSKSLLNVRYRSGGSSPSGFDCSGFISYVYSNFGYNIGRSSRDQAERLASLEQGDLKAGDLVFFNGRHKGSRIGHVGMVVSTDSAGEFRFIHSESGHGITISRSNEPYYKSRFIKAGRVLSENAFASAITAPVVEEVAIVAPAVSMPVVEDVVVAPSSHKVQKGDTLYSIARKYGCTVTQLKRLNKKSDSKIIPGEQLSLN